MSLGYVRMVLKDGQKFKKLAEYIQSCKKKMPITLYMGKFRWDDEKVKTFLEDSNVRIIKLRSNPNENYEYMAVVHRMFASKTQFIHFNPFANLLIEGVGQKTHSHSNRMGLGVNILISDFFYGRQISSISLPIECKLQLGLLFNSTTEQQNWVQERTEELMSELGDELVEVDPYFVEKEEILI